MIMISYKQLYDITKDIPTLKHNRLEMVRLANKTTVMNASKHYDCSRTTVYKWIKRYNQYGVDGLIDMSRKPYRSPHRIEQKHIEKIQQIVLNAKEKKKHITVKNVRKSSKVIDYSDVTINRYINKCIGAIRNLKHLNQTNHSVEWKKELTPFERIQIDIKYLTDIKNLQPFFKDRQLMRYQVTARDIATGFAIVGYCQEKSVFYTTKFLKDMLIPFLSSIKGLNLKDITIQTDNGKEFTNKYARGDNPKKTTFEELVEETFKKHKTNPPACPTWDSDVETFHWSIERDCLAWDDITDNKTLIEYTTEYIKNYWETEIKNRGYSPMEKINQIYDLKNTKMPTPQLLNI